jgi:hypothetical protein
MALKIEIENSVKPLKHDGQALTMYSCLDVIINNALSINTLVDFKGKVFDLSKDVIIMRYFEIGFAGSHAWVCQKGSTERLLLITEKQ